MITDPSTILIRSHTRFILSLFSDTPIGAAVGLNLLNSLVLDETIAPGLG